MQQTITPPQLKTIHTLLGKQGVKDAADKKSVVRQFTDNRTESSKEMSKEEAERLITHLKSMDDTVEKADRMRKKILAMAHEMAWRKPDGKKIDMVRVNNWCKQYGYLHKLLDEYKYAELPMLISQFEEVYRDFIKNVEPVTK